MRTLMIAGLAMVTAFAAVPAESQRLMPAPMAGGQVVTGGGHWSGGGQVMGGGQWSGGGQGQSMPRPPMNGGMPHNPGANYPSPQPQHPPMAPPAHGGHWSNNGGGQWSGTSGGGHWSGGTSAPGGWSAYHRPTRGWSLPRYWIAPSFYISDYGTYGLSTPPAGYGWSRYYDDAVLIDGRGRIADTAYGVDWDGNGYAQGGAGGYASDGYAYAQGGAGGQGGGYSQESYQAEDSGYAEQGPPPPRVIYRDGGQQGSYSSSYSSSAGASSGGYVANGYYFPPATTTVVTIQSAPVVTTTTTEYVETYRAARRVYRPAPRHRVIRRSCTCACGCR